MITKDDLTGLVLFESLSEDQRESLLPYLKLMQYKPGENIFKSGDPAKQFYFLKTGKIVLEKRLSEKVTVSFGSVKPGYSFGWSSMLGTENARYTIESLCSEPCKVVVMDAAGVMDLIKKDRDLGCIFYSRLLMVIKRRLEVRTEQFVRSIANHPECAVFLDEETD